MKNILFKLAIITLVFLVGCNDDEDYPFVGSAGVDISTDGFTILDNELTFYVTAENPACTEVTISGAATGTIALTNGEGMLTISTDGFGDFAIGDEFDFVFTANSEKNPTYYFTVAVDDPISVKSPVVNHSSKTVYYVFDVAPYAIDVTGVTVQTKKSALDAYVDETGPFNAKDSIAIVGTDFNLGDTLFVKVTGSVGTKSTSVESQIVIAPAAFKSINVFALDTTTNLAIDLIKNKVVDASGGESADIEFVASYTLNGLEIGFESNQNAEFVLSTNAIYNLADSVSIPETDFSAAIVSVPNVQVGDVYIYRTMRGTDDYSYGILKVITVDKPQGILEDSFIEIEVKN